MFTSQQSSGTNDPLVTNDRPAPRRKAATTQQSASMGGCEGLSASCCKSIETAIKRLKAAKVKETCKPSDANKRTTIKLDVELNQMIAEIQNVDDNGIYMPFLFDNELVIAMPIDCTEGTQKCSVVFISAVSTVN